MPAPSSAFETRPGRCLTVLLDPHDRARRGSPVVDLVARARRARLAGVTVLKATRGYGRTGLEHRPRRLVDDGPMAVVVVDDPGRIDAFLADAATLLEVGLWTVRDVQVVEL